MTVVLSEKAAPKELWLIPPASTSNDFSVDPRSFWIIQNNVSIWFPSIVIPFQFFICRCGYICTYFLPQLSMCRSPGAPSLSSLITFHLIFWNGISYWTWNSVFWPDWLASELPGLSYLHLPSDGLQMHLALGFLWGTTIWIQILVST